MLANRIGPLLPEGLVRLEDYRRRFRALQLPGRWSLYREYRMALEDSLIELLPSSARTSLRCVVDVGANLGRWSMGIARLTNAQAIIAFEPVPDVFSYLQRNTRYFSQIRCIEAAIGSEVGEIQLNVAHRHQLSSVLAMREDVHAIYDPQLHASSTVTVPLTTLDESLRQYEEISLLKVDVQGYEPEVFRGGQAVLQRTKTLITEVTYSPHYAGDLQFAELHALITSVAPFRLWGISKPNLSPSGEPLWADAIFVQDDRWNARSETE